MEKYKIRRWFRVFEDKTFESVLKSLLSKVPSSLDKREGSVIYDALAPAAAEIAQLYIDMDFTIKETFADTADREYLIRRRKGALSHIRRLFQLPRAFLTLTCLLAAASA